MNKYSDGILIETERLTLRKFVLEDASFLVDLFNSPGWLEFIGNRNINGVDDAISYLERVFFKSYTENGYGFYVIERRTNSASMGICGFVNRKGLDDPDIGYALLPQYTGMGYAFEAAEACMIFAFTNLNFQRLLAITTAANIRSQHLLIKLGMLDKGIIRLADDPEDLMLFEKVNPGYKKN